MRSNFRLFVFMAFFSFSLLLPGLDASQELPFDNPNILISMDFKNASLKDILKIFSIQSGLNFIASEGVQERTLTLYFEKVPLEDAMNNLFKANNLAYDLDRDSSIFIVKDLGKPQVELQTKVFYLKYASVSSSHIMEEVQYNISSAPTTGTTTTTTTSTNKGDRYGVAGDIGITSAVKKLLSKEGSVIEDYRTNSLIVQDVPTRMPMITQAIAALDVSTPQVLIEVEMLDVNKSLVDKIGLKFGQSPFTTVFTGSKLTGGAGNLPFPGNILTSIASTTALSKSYTPGSIDFSTAAYSVILDFLKTQTDTKFLARPQILTLNNETAEFKIETDETVSVTTTTVSQGTNPLSGQTVTRIPTGVKLRVTPQVNSETGEITMFIMPTVKDTSTSSVTTSITVRDPEERSTKSIVRVKDGETVILGGLIRNRKSETITKLPILGDIPIIGAAFRHRNKEQDVERELIVFITPRIVKEKKSDLAKLKTANFPQLPEREQDAVSVADRKAIVDTSLNKFKKK